jgi:hypothetical protein
MLEMASLSLHKDEQHQKEKTQPVSKFSGKAAPKSSTCTNEPSQQLGEQAHKRTDYKY